MYLRTLLSFIVITSYEVGGDDAYDAPVSINLYHSFNGFKTPDWAPFGTISVDSMSNNGFSVIKADLDEKQAQELKKLALTESPYRVKALVKSSNGKETSLYTFSKACSFFQTEPKNDFIINLDHNGSVIGLSLSPKYFCQDTYIDKTVNKIELTFSYKFAEAGPVPDTVSYIQKLEREREAKEKGVGQDNRSFLAKYWMYIVPAVLFVLLSGAASDGGAQTQ